MRSSSAVGDDAEHRHVDAGQPAVLHPQLDPPPPRRLGRRRTDRERAVHAQVGEQRAAVVEAHQQVLAAGVGLAQHGAGEVDADQARIARHAALAALAGEAAVDPLAPAGGWCHPPASRPLYAPHRRVDAVGDDQLDGVGGLLHGDVEQLALRFAGRRDSTWSAPRSFDGGLPTPMRTRRKSCVPRCWVMLRSPLCPASPPPALTRSDRRRQVELVVDDRRCASASSMP